MSDDGTDGEWFDRLLDAASERDIDQMLWCPGGPGEDCGGRKFTVSQLATVGPREQLGISCAECGRAAAKVDVADATGEVREQLAGGSDE